MNAPFIPVKVGRFPRLSPTQKLLQEAADRAVWQQVIADLKLKPGISLGMDAVDYPWTAWEARNVLR